MDEIMEDGNLIDRVRILLQRDMQHYQSTQTILRGSICEKVSGGQLDFPRYTSFASIKIVQWWEAEFLITFRHDSGLWASSQISTIENKEALKENKPSEFIKLIVDTSGQYIEHLHKLVQESLDHADLAVLTSCCSAAALLRNSLWCYTQQNTGKKIKTKRLHKCYKTFQEMSEAIGERLLDLHCRLILLYIFNEADSLSWHTDKCFYEKERSSFVTQTWWLYMQGTREDLWNTVPPKMAQRIFTGMLNESLTVLVTRFIHGKPSFIRSPQFWADAFNVLSCTAVLTLAVYNTCNGIQPEKGETSIAIRDIYAKCNHLLVCLLLRGSPLKVLYEVCRNGLEHMKIIQEQTNLATWLFIAAPRLFGYSSFESSTLQLPEEEMIIFELNIMKYRPQPSWTQVLKVLTMKNFVLTRMLLSHLIETCSDKREEMPNFSKYNAGDDYKINECTGFLCAGCDNGELDSSPSLCLFSLMYISVITEIDPVDIIVPALKCDPQWSDCLGKHQVWNQIRPPWLNAILAGFKDIMLPIVEQLLEAVDTGASIYQAMSLALVCFTELTPCIPIGILRLINEMENAIPANCHPIGGTVKTQILCTALYLALYEESILLADKKKKTDCPAKAPQEIPSTHSFDPHDKCASAIALGESLCSIDADNKHTEQINFMCEQIDEWIEKKSVCIRPPEMCKSIPWLEVLTDDVLVTNVGQQSLKISHQYIMQHLNSILKNLANNTEISSSDKKNIDTDLFVSTKPLTYLMFHIEDVPFDQLFMNLTPAIWIRVMDVPMSVRKQRVIDQIMSRADIKWLDNLSEDDKNVALAIKDICLKAELQDDDSSSSTDKKTD